LPYKQDRLVLTTAIGHPLAEREAISFDETLDYDYIGLLEGSAIHTFIAQATKDVHKTLKIRIQLSNFEALCRMIEANIGVGVLPESVAQRHKKHMAIRIMKLRDEWAVRNLKICVRDMQLLPSFAREMVDMLIIDSQSAASA